MKKIIILLISVILVSCSNTNVVIDRGDDTNEKVVIINKNEELVELTGTLKEVYDNSILIETENGDPYVVHLKEDVKMEEFSIGNTITVGFSGEVMESYPMQINGIKIIENIQNKSE